MENVGNQLTVDDRELMNKFLEQSQEAYRLEESLVANEGMAGGAASTKGFYRICNLPPKQCDDSPLESIEHPERITSKKKSVFGHRGQMIHTDGTGKNTKLTKVYKRDDNRGVLLKALKRMKLHI